MFCLVFVFGDDQRFQTVNTPVQKLFKQTKVFSDL